MADDWYGVRCLFALADRGDPATTSYEERITLWRAPTAEAAMTRAETEAVDYAADVGARYLDFVQSFHLFDEVGESAEVFSLIRDSPLDRDAYVGAFFDTGAERQQKTS